MNRLARNLTWLLGSLLLLGCEKLSSKIWQCY